MASLKPINFKNANRKLYATSGVEGCNSKISLPVWTDGVQCVSCWKCSFLDRLRILFTGRVWARKEVINKACELLKSVGVLTDDDSIMGFIKAMGE